MTGRAIVPLAHITSAIHLVRGHRVMLDADLAALYGVTTKRLNEQVRRNRARFPEDFMFVLAADEAASLKSQFATSKSGRGREVTGPGVGDRMARSAEAAKLDAAIAANLRELGYGG